MKLTLQQQIAAIHRTAKDQGKSEEFTARAVIFWLEWQLDLSLAGNGWLDNDEATREAISEDEKQIQEFKQFMASAGIIGWYNREMA